MLHTDCGAREGDLDAAAREAAAGRRPTRAPMVYDVDAASSATSPRPTGSAG